MNKHQPQSFANWWYKFNCGINHIDEDDFAQCWEAAQASARQEDAINLFNLGKK